MSKSTNKSFEGLNNNKERDIGALDDVVDKIKGAGRVVRDLKEDAQGNLSMMKNRAEEQLRAHPISAGIVILASGFLLGSLLNRR